MAKTIMLTACLVFGSVAMVSAQASPTRANILGNWEITVATAQGLGVLTVTFAEVDGEIKGQAESQYGAFSVSSARVTGNDVIFVISYPASDQSVDVTFRGTFVGDAAEGTVTPPMRPDATPDAWKGKRVPGDT